MVNEVFADAVYWTALLNPRDQWHASAIAAKQAIGSARIVTTEGVLSELLANLARAGKTIRDEAATFVELAFEEPYIDVVRQTQALFFEGLALYKQYDDKTFSLQDCISIVVMRQRGIDQILTLDREFAQAGLTLLMTHPAT